MGLVTQHAVGVWFLVLGNFGKTILKRLQDDDVAYVRDHLFAAGPMLSAPRAS